MALVIMHMARAQPSNTPMDVSDMRPADEEILDVLKNGRDSGDPWGRATKGMLVDQTSYSRNTIYNRLEVLKAAGHVRVAHEPTRVFEYVGDPREGE